MEELFRIGVITEPHGVHGEVKVYPTTDDPDRIKRKIKELIYMDGTDMKFLHPEGVKRQKQLLIIKFKELSTRDEAEKYRKTELFVTRKNAVALNKDEYYISDLIGLNVIDEAKKKVGILKDVIQTGANDVYQILMEDGRELLLPAIKQCVLEVNIEEKYVQVHVMEGLL